MTAGAAVGDSEVISDYTRVLGSVLRRYRDRLGWTREYLVERLPEDEGVSKQALGTYEHGTRRLSVDRLAVICHALGTRPGTVLAEVDVLLLGRQDAFPVDLALLASTTRADLAPAARWARVTRAAQNKPVVELTVGALATLAELCGLEFAAMAHELRELRFKSYRDGSL